MEEGAKKPILVGIIVLCLIVAGAVFWMSRGDSVDVQIRQFSGEMMWVKCLNPKCGAEYEVDKAVYFKFVEDNAEGVTAPPMQCEKCGEESVYRAVKCEKCGLVFLRGAVERDFADRCPNPECKYSAIEEARKRER